MTKCVMTKKEKSFNTFKIWDGKTMKIELKKVANSREIYNYMKALPFPYNYEVEVTAWEKSFFYDIDGDGRILFSDLTTIGAYLSSRLVGFIQYGRTALGFDENGEISDTVCYSVIRNFILTRHRRKLELNC